MKRSGWIPTDATDMNGWEVEPRRKRKIKTRPDWRDRSDLLPEDPGATSNNLPRFAYSQLPDRATHIRLLCFEQGNFGGPFRFSLVSSGLSTAPAYDAVSYAWGDVAPVSDVVVNGQAFAVRSNCYYTLRQLAAFRLEGYFWIDSICINQDDAAEKAAQVQMMGDIFSRAGTVHASLGRHADDSEVLLRSLVAYRTDFRIHQGRIGSKAAFYESALGAVRPSAHDWRIDWRVAARQTKTTSESDRLLRAFVKLAWRPYWTRQWVLQELCLARRTRVHCAGISMQLAVIQDFADQSRFSRVTKWRTAMSSPMMTMLGHVAACKSHPLQFGDVLTATALQCFDIRDRIFGTIAIVDWGAHDAPRTDYCVSPTELTIQCLKYLWSSGCESQRNWDAFRPKLWHETIALARTLHVTQEMPDLGALLDALPLHKRNRSFPDTQTEMFAASRVSRTKRHVLYKNGYVAIKKNKQGCLSTGRAPQALRDTTPETNAWTKLLQRHRATQPRPSSVSQTTFPFLWDHDKIIGILPRGARAGDWLIPVDRPGHIQLCIVVRHSSHGQHEVLGAALLSFSFQPKKTLVSVYFTEQDWLALVIPDVVDDLQRSTAELARLGFAFSRSTYAVGESGQEVKGGVDEKEIKGLFG